MIHVLAIITAKPGMRDAILKEFRANMPAVHAEKGCIEYGPATDAEGIGGFQTKFGDDTFVVIEKWESPDALKAHAAAPHMAAYGAKTRDMILPECDSLCDLSAIRTMTRVRFAPRIERPPTFPQNIMKYPQIFHLAR
jgi:quinol monooxygenase YgiN